LKAELEVKQLSVRQMEAELDLVEAELNKRS
jgi:hypothetical protein